jgi:hypothetical protein
MALAAAVVMTSPAAAHDEQFMTLVRADRHSKLGLQAGLHIYDDLDDVFGLRTELYGQAVGNLRGGGTIGGYAHVALAFLFGEDALGNDRNEAAIHGVELGGFYVTGLGRGTDLVLHAGVSLPTASGGAGEGFALRLLGLERNVDLVNSAQDTTALKLGVTLHTLLGRSGFLQGDVAVDLELDAPGDNDQLLHANLGLGVYVGRVALMGELATAFVDDGMFGSLGLSLRFLSPLHPHLGYILAFVDDDGLLESDGVVAHIVSVGFYAVFR